MRYIGVCISLILLFFGIFVIRPAGFVLATSGTVNITATVPGCGDNIIEGIEQCDGSDLGGSTCASLGFAGGDLSCNANCDFDVSKCTNVVAPTVPIGGGGNGSFYPTVITTAEQIPEPTQPALPEEPQLIVTPVAQAQLPIAGLLPSAVADLSQKIPQFATILSNLNVKNTQDVSNLKNYNIFLPGLASITGGSFSSLTADQKEKIPSDTAFVLMGNKNIDAPAKFDFSDTSSAVQKINVLENKPISLVVRPSSPVKSVTGAIFFKSDNLANSDQGFSVLQFAYKDNNDGTYVADINSPGLVGQYQIITSINYVDSALAQKEIKTTTLVDPDGYIYEKTNKGEVRVAGAQVTLYKMTSKDWYEPWDAITYGQENPQITDTTGNYSFLVPAGTYYLTVSALGYNSYKTDNFSVIEGKEIRNNISLKEEFDWSSLLNWDTVFIIILFCLVFYNFYMDVKERKRKAIKK